MGTRGGAMVASGGDPEDEALDPELIHDLGLYELHDESRDGDPLDVLRADVRAHCAIGERALPECAHKNASRAFGEPPVRRGTARGSVRLGPAAARRAKRKKAGSRVGRENDVDANKTKTERPRSRQFRRG